jgi:hypothetical protein
MMEAAGKDNSEVAIRLSSRIKGLANRKKNYRGKLQGFHRLDLLAKKRQEEKDLQAFIDGDVKRKAQYGAVLPEIDRIYGEMMAEANRNHILGQIIGSSILLSAGYTAFKLSAQLQKDDLQREPAYMNRNLPALKSRLELAYADRNEKIDQLFLKEILRKAARLPDEQKIGAVETIIKKSTDGAADEAIDKFVEEAHANSKLRDAALFKSLMTMQPEETRSLNDPFIEFAAALEVDLEKNRETERARQGALAKLFAQLIEVKQQWKQTEFIPDANGTLRLTFGRIRGYSPNDAVEYEAITTVAGVYQKNLSGHEDFAAPAGLLDLWRAKDFGRFKSEKLQDVPVAILYDTDTTGGNSGSPVLNANGELVGVNFDRAYEATINDYQWSTEYSRSIAVDIRYVLWVVQKFAGAGFLLQELGIN